MDKIQKVILISIISIAAISWILSKDQSDMMTAMANYNPIVISLFTISWTIGMAAMMFPAIVPMVLIYNRLVKNNSDSNRSSGNNTLGKDTDSSQTSVFAGRNNDDEDGDDDNTFKRQEKRQSSLLSLSNVTSSINITLFVGSYLLVWAITGIVLLLTWSIPVNYLFMHLKTNQIQIVYGVILIVSGVYQFSSLKTKCLGYCESPLRFFMRRWRSGSTGALKMGMYHGLYCLGCCWPYFLLMISLGWMNLLWMALFAGVIFGEKVWSKGIWVARSTGVVLAIVGIMAIVGLIIIPTGMDNDDNNNHPSNNRNDGSAHMGSMKMDNNMNMKKPTTALTTMPNMKTM
jgi:predicted metal-binding membrane protein